MIHKPAFFSVTTISRFFLFSAIAAAAACSKDDDTPPPAPNTVVNVASNNGFTTLAGALNTAGLTATLNGTGPFTVFAPTNAAFAAITVPSDPTALGNILKYHVLNGKVLAAALPTSYTPGVVTLNGDSVYVKKFASGNAYVNGIKVDQADVNASNGAVHVIGSVLIPPAASVVAVAQSDTSFKLLVQAVVKCGLATALSAPGSLTVFAPTNAAFRAAGFDSTAIANANAGTVTTLTSVLQYHVVPVRAFSADLVEGLTTAPTLLTGKSLTFSVAGGAKVTGSGNGGTASNIVKTNIVAKNGVVHVIDRVLLP
ncbi:MAG TPA: fasciclin domain-containing protein [Chitinophagaceae bacterium]|nr:fasciclin domain-containing protein [Chitinophagaceae bacterium]